jgi:hypothetical protein
MMVDFFVWFLSGPIWIVAMLLIFALIIWTTYLGDTGMTKREKRYAAQQYVAWLERRYPGLSVTDAALERSKEIDRDFLHSRKQDEEILRIRLVREGWQDWLSDSESNDGLYMK